jgi:hypothetical protein
MAEIVTGPNPAFVAQQQQNQSDLVGNFARLQQLKSLIQNAPVQQQILQQQAQSGQLQLQQEQQAQKDQQAFRDAMADPEMQGKSLGQIADALAKKGGLSAQTYSGLKKADLEQRQTLATLDKDQLANADAAHKQTQTLYNNAMNMDDATLAQNWPTIAQQYDAIPGNNKMPLDPNKPLTKQQLQQFGPMISMQEGYLSAEAEKRKTTADTQEKQTKAQIDQMNLDRGGTTDFDKFTSDYLKANSLENNPTNRQKAFDVYTEKTKIKPAEVRMNAMLQLPTEVADPNSPGETIMVRRNEAAGMKGKGSASVQSIKGEEKYFTSGKGAQQLTAFNTAMQHLDLLDKLGADLKNTNLQIANRAKQAWATATGSAEPANFEAAKNAMSGEVAAALKASGATDKEIEKVDSTFSRAQSPIQLKGAIATYRMLLKSKAHNLQNQYQQGMQGKPNFQPDDTAPAAQPGGSDPFAQFGGKAH